MLSVKLMEMEKTARMAARKSPNRLDYRQHQPKIPSRKTSLTLTRCGWNQTKPRSSRSNLCRPRTRASSKQWHKQQTRIQGECRRAEINELPLILHFTDFRLKLGNGQTVTTSTRLLARKRSRHCKFCCRLTFDLTSKLSVQLQISLLALVPIAWIPRFRVSPG